VRVQARVADVLPDRPDPEVGKIGTFTADARAVERRGEWAACTGRLRVKVEGGSGSWAAGDLVEIVGLLRDLPVSGNPGQFDFGARLSDRGISKLITTPSRETVRILERGFPGPRALLQRLRNGMAATIAREFPEREGALLAALLLGDQGRIAGETRDDFVRSGTIHLLAVSGLHLVLVASGLFFALRWVGVTGRPAAAILVAFVWAFAALTGAGTPVLRAAVMTTVYLVADLVGKERDSWNALAISAVILLVARPSEAFGAGFQLSYGAVMGILLFARPISSALLGEEKLVLLLSRRPADRFRASVSAWTGFSMGVSLAAWIATGPLVLHHFQLITPVVPLSNLIAVPLAGPVLAAGFLTLPLLWAFPGAEVLAAPAAGLAWLLGETARFFGGLPGSHFYVPSPPAWRLAAGYAVLIAFSARRWGPQRLRKVPWFAAGALAGILFLWPVRPERPPGLEMSVLDVGQGACTVIRFPDGRILVSDAGTKSGFPVAEWVIAPFLWSKRESRIHLLVFTHPDADHVSGTEGILDRFRVDRVAVPAGFSATPEGRAVLEELRRRRIPVDNLEAGMPPPPGWADAIDVLHPPRRSLWKALPGTNNTSLALAVRYGGRRILLPGDLERAGLSMLAAAEGGAGFDVILAPHHGANEVPGNEPFARMGPRVVAMSNGWSFGVEETAALYRKHGARVYETARGGAVTIRISPDGEIEAEEFKEGKAAERR
jgi:competence protein ComEC